jgi:hypothetical protein
MTRTVDDASLGELVSKLTEETSTILREELKLARVEMTTKGRYAGIGAGMLGAGALLAVLGLGTLVAAAVLGLATTIPSWAAALVVAAVLLAVASIVALRGKKEIADAVPPVPEEALAGVKLDLAALKR